MTRERETRERERERERERRDEREGEREGEGERGEGLGRRSQDAEGIVEESRGPVRCGVYPCLRSRFFSVVSGSVVSGGDKNDTAIADQTFAFNAHPDEVSHAQTSLAMTEHHQAPEVRLNCTERTSRAAVTPTDGRQQRCDPVSRPVTTSAGRCYDKYPAPLEARPVSRRAARIHPCAMRAAAGGSQRLICL